MDVLIVLFLTLLTRLSQFTPDFDKKYYPMTVPDLQKCGLDLWLVGYTHTQYPANPGVADRIFFPGTPEPDGLDCQQEGKAWFFEIDNDKKVHPVLLSTGTFRFLHEEVKINSVKDIKHLERRFSSDDYKVIVFTCHAANAKLLGAGGNQINF